MKEQFLIMHHKITRENEFGVWWWCLSVAGFPTGSAPMMVPVSKYLILSPLAHHSKPKASESFASSQSVDSTDIWELRPRNHREFTYPKSTVHTIMRITSPRFPLKQKSEKKNTKHCCISITVYAYVEFWFYYTSFMPGSHLISSTRCGLWQWYLEVMYECTHVCMSTHMRMCAQLCSTQRPHKR